MNDYEKFIEAKTHLGGQYGFKPLWLPDCMFDFQKMLTEWSLLKGRNAIFADCGLGKTLIELVWSENVVRHTNGNVLLLTPLAVGHQTVKEGEKFGVECARSMDGKITKKITVANYERLHYFNPKDFEGVACDESSILKSYDGATKAAITDFMRKVKYRSLYTATAAPNDYIELGTSSEAIGELGYLDMLKMFFKSCDGSYAHGGSSRGTAARFNRERFDGKFRFRGHAERDFWRWVCSWARAVRKPSDLGCEDNGFILPELKTTQHVVEAKNKNPEFLFDLPAMTLQEQREERRRTLQERCEKAAELIHSRKGSSVAWCSLNDEGNLLEKLVKDSVQVSGTDSDEEKEEKFAAFASGKVKRLISKSVIAGFGLNWQFCDHQTHFVSHSFEQWYQAIRRSWRFGQKNPVTIDMVSSEGESRVLGNLTRKAEAAEKMFAQLVALMNNELQIKKTNTNVKTTQTPLWLQTKKLVNGMPSTAETVAKSRRRSRTPVLT